MSTTSLSLSELPLTKARVPPNVTFEADDLEKEWTWNVPFDFIFARILAGSLVSYEDFVRKAYDNLEPGGYIELQEVELPYRSDDGTLPEDSDIARYGQLFKDACKTINRPMVEGDQLEEWVRKAGFVNVTRTQLKWPLNSWPADKHYKEIGAWCHYNVDQGLEGLSLALFTRILGWSKEETLVFCGKVRNQFKDRSIHAYSPMSVQLSRGRGGLLSLTCVLVPSSTLRSLEARLRRSPKKRRRLPLLRRKLDLFVRWRQAYLGEVVGRCCDVFILAWHWRIVRIACILYVAGHDENDSSISEIMCLFAQVLLYEEVGLEASRIGGETQRMELNVEVNL